MPNPGHIRIKGPFPPPTGFVGPDARKTASHVYEIFNGDGRKLMGGTYGPDQAAAVAYAKGLAAGKGLPAPTVEIIAPVWRSEESAPGAWYVVKPDGTRANAGPWPSQAAADDALGYLAWVAGGGSAD